MLKFPIVIWTMMPRHNAQGFTLVEIMTALAVLAIAFVILIGLRNHDIALSGEASSITQATLLARQKISEIEIIPLEEKDKGERTGDFGEDYPDYRWEIEVNETGFDPLREFVFRILWKNQRREDHVEFVRYFFVKT